MIIIEGCDNSGKTTTALKLSRDLEVPVRHSETPNPLWTQRECRDHAARQMQPQRIIRDRLYVISESVYGPVLRGENALGDYVKESLMDLYCRDHLIIYCRPKLETILRNKGRDQMKGVLSEHSRLVEDYDSLMMDVARFGNCRVIQFDWENHIEYSYLKNECAKHLLKFDQKTWSAHHQSSKGVAP